MADNNTICSTCPYESTIEELKRDSERNSNQHKEFYDKFTAQSTAIAISEERYNNLISVVTEIKSSIVNVQASVDELKQKPAKKWDQVSFYVLTCVLGLVIGYLFNMLVG